jgi:hypothetical protein
VFDGTLEIRTSRGSYRQPRNFSSTPQLLDRVSVDVGDRTGVACVVVEIRPTFTDDSNYPSLHVICEELDLHHNRVRIGA